MEETMNGPVQMYYAPDAGGPHAMVLTGVGYFEKGKLTEVASKAIADDLVKRKKGPRVATAEDLAAVKQSAAVTADEYATGEIGTAVVAEISTTADEANADEEHREIVHAIAGVGRRAKKGESVTAG